MVNTFLKKGFGTDISSVVDISLDKAACLFSYFFSFSNGLAFCNDS